MENNNYCIGYLDEEEQWRLTARNGLKSDFKIVVLDLPQTPDMVWPAILENKLDAIIVDFRLFENGEVTYNGNDVIVDVQKWQTRVSRLNIAHTSRVPLPVSDRPPAAPGGPGDALSGHPGR